MNTRFRLGLILLGGLVVVAVFTFPLWRPLFVDDVVNEAFPGLPADMQDDFLALPPEEQEAFMKMREENEEMAMETVKAALSADEQVEEDMPPEMSDQPVVVVTGNFIEIDLIHGATGKATVYRLPDDSLVLRLDEFRSTNGPDLHVVLSKHSDPRNSTDLGADYRDLGKLKGNVGSQNYDIPADINIDEFNSVVIYCLPFHVVFSTATLN